MSGKFKMKMWICRKCGRVFDDYETYDSLPRYGKKIHPKKVCHKCRKKLDDKNEKP